MLKYTKSVSAGYGRLLHRVLRFICLLLLCWMGASKSVVKPNLKTHECLRRAHYNREPDRFVCKDLGLCYKHYCQQVARRCNTCKQSKVSSLPCLVFKSEDDSNSTTPEPRQKFVTIDGDLFQTSAAPLPSDLPQKLLLRLTAGDKECSAFLLGIPYKKRKIYVVVTAAQCVVDFSVRCTALNEYKNETLTKNEDYECFGYQRWQVQMVKKGFRSYCATLNHKDKSAQIALNAKNVMVARQYMECGDCRYDLAAIRVTSKNYEELNISHADARIAVARPKSQLANLTATVASLLEGCGTGSQCMGELFNANGAVNSVQKMKLCVALSNTTNKMAENLLPGSPVSITGDDDALETVGVATHIVPAKMYANTQGENESDPSMVRVPLISVVRITKGFVNFVGRWLEETRKKSPCALSLHPRFDCYPSYPKALVNQSMCICSRGWTNERNACKNAMEVMSDKCKWNARQRNANCDDRRLPTNSSRRQKRAIEVEVIPGFTSKLTLLHNNVTNGVEVEEILRHLTNLSSLVLDCNRLEKAMWKTFQYGRKLQFLSLRHNNMTWLHSGTFRKNRRLMHVGIANNSLTEINNKHFANQVHLIDLDLSYNQISAIAEKAFRKLKKLERVNLSNNRLQTLHRYLFQKNSKLKEIWLENNLLEKLSPELFRNCPDLRFVNLEGNALTGLPKALFMSNTLLHLLNLNNNKLKALPSDLLDHQNYIEHVTIYNNIQLPPAFTLSEFSNSTVNNLKQFLDQYGRG